MAQQVFERNQLPTRGLYTSAVADSLDPSYTPWCQNVRFRFGQILRAPGRSRPLFTRSGSTIMDFATLVDATGKVSIYSIEDTNGLTSIALYNPTAATFGPQIQLGITKQRDVRISWTQGEERLFIARGSQVAAVAPGGVVEVLSIARDASGNPILDGNGQTIPAPAGCFLVYFKNHLLMLNTTDMPNRIQWTANAVYKDWATTTDHGGFLDLYDGIVEPITGAKVLGNRLAIYRTSSISDFVATGDPTSPFLPDGRVFGLGCLVPNSLVNLGQMHFFVANDYNVWSWDGVNLTPIGTPIHKYVRELYDPDSQNTWMTAPFGAAFMGFKEYWLCFPSPTGGSVVLIYDYLRDTWTRDFIDIPLCALFEQILPTDPQLSVTGYPVKYPVLMGANQNQYFLIDERVIGDNISPGGMDMWVDTPDMYYDKNAIHNGTLERVLIAQGTEQGDLPYQLQISIDRGQTFAITKTITPLDTHWGFEFVDTNVTNNVRRMRFMYPRANGPATPSLRSYTSVYVPAGEFFPVERPIGTTLSAASVNAGQARVPVGANEPVPANLRRRRA